MRFEAEKFAIRLKRPFRIAHGSSDIRDTILVHLHGETEGLIAHGEGALPPYYPSTSEASLAWLEAVAQVEDAVEWEVACDAQGPPGAAAGRVALEIALQDLKAQRAGKPLWRLWNFDPARIPPCWRTLSIPQNEKELQEMLDEGISLGSKHIKLKTGSGDLGWDVNCMRLARARPVLLGLDANGGWSPEDAQRILCSPVCQGIAFVEQPVSREFARWDELRSRVHGMKVPPLVADESLQTEGDLTALKGRADGVNVKLLKAGGLRASRRWIAIARDLGMGVMVGTMVETGIGRTAAAQLAPMADWLDIDSPDSIPAAPMAGFRMVGDHLVLTDRPGLGLRQAL